MKSISVGWVSVSGADSAGWNAIQPSPPEIESLLADRAGKAAVARYALPNPAPASNVFTIKPHKDTVIQHGIVEPANDQPGGGVEVLFRDGTQPGTVTGPDKIPDE